MSNFSPSINIIRDDKSAFEYIVTPNAQNTVNKIFENLKSWRHSFNLIGSFGTGKSSFLLALEKSIKGEKGYFDIDNTNCALMKLVGDYSSLSEALSEELSVKSDYTGNQFLFDALYQRYESIAKKNGILFIVVDEFGKFLEHAAQNKPEKEIYFLQKLAEFVNNPERNIILLTSIHQSAEAYGVNLTKELFQEWKKVQGRFVDLPFNEPIEHLLHLAAHRINAPSSANSIANESSVVERNGLFDTKLNSDSIGKLFPLTLTSGYALAISLQRYGQNERSLFTFLNSHFFDLYRDSDQLISLSDLYDYLNEEFYSFLYTRSNPDFGAWIALKTALERAESLVDKNPILSTYLLKTIGLLSIFAKAGGSISLDFLENYLSYKHSKTAIRENINLLEKTKIIRYSRFDDSFKLFEGTDLDIDQAIALAENKIDSIDVLTKLSSHFDFPIIIAKSITYRLGTPRLYEFRLSKHPISDTPKGQIDGYINLLFNESGVDTNQILELSENNPIIYGYFSNTSGIVETLLEIEKTKQVLKDVEDEKDRVAIKELRSIIKSNENLLNHYVMNSLYTNKVDWYYLGKKAHIKSQNTFNQKLSEISAAIYHQAPVLQNELINRDKVSGSISSARKNYWRALVNNYHLKNLGFPETKWPAEKTIYFSLLKETGIHIQSGDAYTLTTPTSQSFASLWQISMNFLDDAKVLRKGVDDFYKILSQSPLKLKQGVIDFWVPTFLFINRGNFALYNENGFVPYVDDTILFFITKNPKEYSVKSFELNTLRLNLFNKYRDFLQQGNKEKLDNDSFIESIRPLLIFYRDLSEYAKNTKTISKEAIALREAISKATDPEKTFFENFPNALGYSTSELSTDDTLFEDYIIKFQNAIQEIKNSYDELIDRVELFICDELIGERIPFKEYQNRLQKRFEDIKEHQALTRHKVFLLRVKSNLPDRNSYLMSLAQALTNKRLDGFKDLDELLIKDKMLTLVKELDNLVDLTRVEQNPDEELIKVEFTTLINGSIENIIRLPKEKKGEVSKATDFIYSELAKYKNLKMPILMALLEKELTSNDKT